MTMSGADRESLQNQINSLNVQMRAALTLLESLTKQREQFAKLDDKVSDIDIRLRRLEVKT